MTKDLFYKFDNLNFIEDLEVFTTSFTVDGDNLILNLVNIDFIKKSNFKIIFENIKNRNLIVCNYIINNKDLIIDLTNIKLLSNDYEYRFYLVNAENNYMNICCPKFKKLSLHTPPITDNNSYKYKWFIRVLKNGEFRISTVSIFDSYYDVIL
ncbi:hypothetical protein [Clostridium sp.]|uniref:hypothetical protein n=1 Tax=Clostridium sp. TaxID=1506 RepID=UPI00262D1FD3|nr:hypothetical protein [Clostridium sp.]